MTDNAHFTRLESVGDFATLTLSRPEAKNALSREMLLEIEMHLLAILEACQHSVGPRALILRGSSGVFAAGADIRQMAHADDAALIAYLALGQRVVALLQRLPLPTLCVAEGAALGGGLEFLLACDWALATPKTRFGLPEVKLGIMPGFGGTQRLAKRVGELRASELAMTGRIIDADEALAIGLVLDVVEPADLEARIEGLLAPLGLTSPAAVAATKRALAAAETCDIERGLAFEAAEFASLIAGGQREGFQAFLEKRLPSFARTPGED